MRTIIEIIRDAGGARGIEAATEGRIKSDAVYKWSANGIPDRHWPVMIKHAGASPDELFEANRAVRETAA